MLLTPCCCILELDAQSQKFSVLPAMRICVHSIMCPQTALKNDMALLGDLIFYAKPSK
jgi:hypothetical protein